jgi:hypothetical protein
MCFSILILRALNPVWVLRNLTARLTRKTKSHLNQHPLTETAFILTNDSSG